MKTIHSSLEPLEARIAPAVFIVTNTNDGGDGSLREALMKADSASFPGHDTIVFHLPAPPLHSENIITLTTGELTSMGNVTIQGPGAGKLIINGNAADRVFSFSNGMDNIDAPVSISGLSIINGKTSGGGGGGIYSAESLTLKNAVISSNAASGGGGGIDVDGNVKAVISNSLIAGNSSGGNGGGLRFTGLASVTVSKTVVTGNTITSGGGGIYSTVNATGTGIKITGSEISGNSAGFDGGVFVRDFNSAPASKIIISKTKITGNVSTATDGTGGGGLYVGAGNTVITDSTIRNNTAVYNGGGIRVGSNFNSLTISKSVITGNQTTKTNATYQGGGGLFILGSGSATPQPVKISGTKITDNHSAQLGGGLFANNGLALAISGSDFSGNHATASGGGIFTAVTGANKVDVSISGSLFSGNSAGVSGGGMDLEGDGIVSLVSSKVTGNVAGFGGGIRVASAASATLKNVAVTGNFAGNSVGGLAIANTPAFKIIGGSFKDNMADGDGGGIFIENATGSIHGTLITGNAAGTQGGGIFQAGTGSVLIDKLAKVIANTAPTDPDVSGPFTFV